MLDLICLGRSPWDQDSWELLLSNLTHPKRGWLKNYFYWFLNRIDLTVLFSLLVLISWDLPCLFIRTQKYEVYSTSRLLTYFTKSPSESVKRHLVSTCGVSGVGRLWESVFKLSLSSLYNLKLLQTGFVCKIKVYKNGNVESRGWRTLGSFWWSYVLS